MPIIARSPVRASWQKTTCSCSARAEPSSRWGIANTLVTVATLLLPSRFPVEPDKNKRMPERGPRREGQVLDGARCVPCRLVTDSRDDLVTFGTAVATFWYVTIRQ